MSKYYGQIDGSAKTMATRRGFHEITASVQSYNGSVITHLYDDCNGKMRLSVRTSDVSSFYGNIIFDGTIEEFTRILKAAQQ